MRNREAVLRSTTSAVPSPWSCWSLLTSASSELARIRVLEAVLVLRAAHPILDGEILHRLHEELDALDPGKRGLEAADDVARTHPATGERLQVDEDPPAVDGDVGAVHPDERGQALDRRILQDHRGQGLLPCGHRRE